VGNCSAKSAGWIPLMNWIELSVTATIKVSTATLTNAAKLKKSVTPTNTAHADQDRPLAADTVAGPSAGDAEHDPDHVGDHEDEEGGVTAEADRAAEIGQAVDSDHVVAHGGPTPTEHQPHDLPRLREEYPQTGLPGLSGAGFLLLAGDERGGLLEPEPDVDGGGHQQDAGEERQAPAPRLPLLLAQRGGQHREEEVGRDLAERRPDVDERPQQAPAPPVGVFHRHELVARGLPAEREARMHDVKRLCDPSVLCLYGPIKGVASRLPP
jgi:hypothetical protein